MKHDPSEPHRFKRSVPGFLGTISAAVRQHPRLHAEKRLTEPNSSDVSPRLSGLSWFGSDQAEEGKEGQQPVRHDPSVTHGHGLKLALVALVTLLVLLVFLTGCGASSQPGSAQTSQGVLDAHAESRRLILAGDAQQACDEYLTPSARTALDAMGGCATILAATTQDDGGEPLTGLVVKGAHATYDDGSAIYSEGRWRFELSDR